VTVVNHAAAALARLPEYLKDKPKLAALLATYTAQCDSLEATFQQLLLQRSADTAVGYQLDRLGVIVGQDRGGLGDADYRRYLRARIATNRSRGTVEDILKIAALVINDVVASYEIRNTGTAAYVLRVVGIALTTGVAAIALAFLQAATAGGVRVILEAPLDAPASLFTYDTGPGWDVGHFIPAYD